MMKSLILCFILMLSVTALHAQVKSIDLGLDSLSMNEILKIQSDAKGPSFKIDSVHVELFLNGEKVAIIPASLRNKINRKKITHTESSLETLANKKTILVIKEFMLCE